MINSKILASFISFENDSILSVLKKIDGNEKGCVACVDSGFVLKGVITDGDIRRIFINQPNFDVVSGTALSVMNTNYQKRIIGSANIKSLSPQIKFLPIVDKENKLIGIDFDGNSGFFIGKHYISKSTHPFIIAEIGNNHNGSLELAKRLIDHAKEAGVHCVKFQHRNLDTLYKDQGDGDLSSDLSTQYTKDLLVKYNLSKYELFEAFDYCKSLDLIPLCTPWDLESITDLQEYGLDAYKIASADLTNHQLISKVGSLDKPMIVSTGMSTEVEISEVIELLEKINCQYAILHCNSTYPAPLEHINLSFMDTLKQMTDAPVGYSGHERGIYASIAAVACGASVIERHLTLDREMEGADHKASLLPGEFKELVNGINQVTIALGSSSTKRVVSQGELLNRHNLAKSLVSTRKILIGEKIQKKDITSKSPGSGLQPNRMAELVGVKASRLIEIDDFFYQTDLSDKKVAHFKNLKDWVIGIPVRYHDYRKLVKSGEYDFVEFHFSYKDLALDPKDYIEPYKKQHFSVHAPELFENDHLLDLAAIDDDYRDKSVEYLKLTIDRTLQLRDIYKMDQKPVIVVNCGGFSRNGFIEPEVQKRKYDLVSESFRKLEINEVKVCIQTMPPFPWHFGGQQYHNLFVSPVDIANFCSQNNVYCCLDTSHTLMAANYLGFDFYDAVHTLSPFVQQIHLADARGVDQEGVIMGEGDLDLRRLIPTIRNCLLGCPIVCETWQGHVNNGAGFSVDLKFFSKYSKLV